MAFEDCRSGMSVNYSSTSRLLRLRLAPPLPARQRVHSATRNLDEASPGLQRLAQAFPSLAQDPDTPPTEVQPAADLALPPDRRRRR